MTAQAQAFSPEERKSYLGASEIAAAVGLDKWKTRLDLFNEKLGLVAPFTGNAHTERGNRLEAIAADYYTEKTGHKLRRRSEEFRHPVHSFIVGHVDRVVVGEKRLIEIKCPTLGAFRKLQREGLPPSYIIQANAYMGLSGIPNLTYVIFCADAWDAAIFDIDFDADLFAGSIAGAVAFWTGHVLPMIPPDLVANEKPALELEAVGGEVVRRDDPAWAEAAQLLREAEQIKRDGEELFELAKGKVLDAIEAAEGVYEGAGLRLYYKSQAGRKTFDKKALQAAHPELDISRFEKVGKPSTPFRPFWIGGNQ